MGLRSPGGGRGVAARAGERGFELRRERAGATGPDPASFLCAEKTPWSLAPPAGQETTTIEPRLADPGGGGPVTVRIALCRGRCDSPRRTNDPAVCPAHELHLAEALRQSESQERLLQAIADSRPFEPLENWAKRAGVVWCAEPEVNAARVSWCDEREGEPAADGSVPAGDRPEPSAPDRPENRTPTLVLPLYRGGRVQAEIQLWCNPSQAELLQRVKIDASSCRLGGMGIARGGTDGDGAAVAGRSSRRFRQQAEDDEARIRDRKLQALAEFAAGAGHELNNPLAVIVGRAQLLLGRTQDAETSRSLRIILGQAQRTHRILRDLMFVARPPSLRPRSCRPSEVLRSCLASVREECEARNIRLESELEPGEPQTWADPEALGHLAETLVRNAIQATPPGGKVQVRSQIQGSDLRWWICDSGKGISPAEGAHLFDPFYCGRQAGRGLGLGLPRAARFVALAGGSLHWSSPTGQGTTFQVQLPLVNPPEMVGSDLQPDRPRCSAVRLRQEVRHFVHFRPSHRPREWQSGQRNVTLSGSE